MHHLHHRPLKSIHPFVSKHYRYAIVGASSNPEKFGNIVFFDLKNSGFMVVPINPNLSELGGITAAASLQQVVPKPDVAVVIVPPALGVQIMNDAVTAGVNKLWFQPGAESKEIVKKAADLGLEIVADGSCIMVVKRQLDL